MSADPIADSFATLRELTPNYAHNLINLIEQRLDLAERMIREYEAGLAEMRTLVAPGDTPSTVSSVTPENGPELVTQAGAAIIPLHKHSVRVP